MANDDHSTPAPPTEQPASTPITHKTPGSSLPERDPRVLERGAQGDIEKRQR